MIKFVSIEALQDFVNIINTIEKICQEWAKQNLDSRWQYYRSFEVKQDYIIINYAYNDIVNNIEYETCYDSKCVSWEDMIEFAKTLGI
jgi:hypothetical protein